MILNFENDCVSWPSRNGNGALCWCFNLDCSSDAIHQITSPEQISLSLEREKLGLTLVEAE